MGTDFNALSLSILIWTTFNQLCKVNTCFNVKSEVWCW